jgi:hypothetical protein
MLSKLEIKPRTPSPLLPTTLWNPKTPKTAQEIAAQSTLIINRIRTHASSSPTPLVGLMEQFYRGVDIVIHSATLIAQHNEQLQAASTAAAEGTWATVRLQRRMLLIPGLYLSTSGQGKEDHIIE